ncbi:MAG TPA: ATP-binding protein [Polyangiaceae bacterium]|nr:ATP-binding protein [Polyangiaceae bacterium]
MTPEPTPPSPPAGQRIRRRLAAAIVATALIPVIVAIFIAESMVRQTSERFFTPELGTRLDQSLDLYQELARAVKSAMRYEASAIAADAPLRQAALAGDAAGVQKALERVFPAYPNLVSLSVVGASDEELGNVKRKAPLDVKRENRLEVPRSLSDSAQLVKPSEQVDPADEEEEEQELPEGPRVIAVFAADKARFEELAGMSEFVDTYRQIERSRASAERASMYAFTALLGITILGAIGVGSLFARGVSSRIAELADATKRVGAGDLSIRVPESGNDEIADLAREFNRMLGEVETSRARIEYLQRIGAWQEMARRLAHEIKNPLTPIQLAVQEIQRRYSGADATFEKLLETTREIVEDEVATLRRLVSEFSDFARLPQASLDTEDLAEFLREQAARQSLLDHAVDAARGLESGQAQSEVQIGLEFDVPEEAANVYLDRQMFARALINLTRNAQQAIDSAGKPSGRIVVRLTRQGDFWVLDIDDDGPGIPAEMRQSVFDPYVTTKNYGTGLGLAIVKKIIVEHAGSIAAETSPLGGARIRLRLPAVGSKAAQAALVSRDLAPISSGRFHESLLESDPAKSR